MFMSESRVLYINTDHLVLCTHCYLYILLGRVGSNAEVEVWLLWSYKGVTIAFSTLIGGDSPLCPQYNIEVQTWVTC